MANSRNSINLIRPRRPNLRGVAIVGVLLGGVCLAILVLMQSRSPSFGTSSSLAQQGTRGEHPSAVSASAATAEDLVRVEGTAISVAPQILTYLDGVPTPTLLRDVSTVLGGGAVWKDASHAHAMPDTGNTFAVLGQGLLVEILRRRDIAKEGDVHVDMKRAPVLDVRLVSVPPMLRDQMLLQLQLEYSYTESEEVNRASVLMGDRSPKIMHEDRVLVPLGVRRGGRLTVLAKSRHSNISYAAPSAVFEPVSQVIEMDLSTLASACSLAALSLTLRFPYRYPEGEISVSLDNSRGDTITRQKFERDGASERVLQFKDLPRELITPVVSVGLGTDPLIRLDPIDTAKASEHEVREVVAEGSVHVFLFGGRDPPDGKVSILVRDALGRITASAWPTGSDHTFRRLPAIAGFVQAISYEHGRCSPVVRFAIKASEAQDVGLRLVPAGKVVVPARAFGSTTQFLDAHYADGDPSRVFLNANRVSTVWLPTGAPLVRWTGNQSVLRVNEGVVNSWAP